MVKKPPGTSQDVKGKAIALQNDESSPPPASEERASEEHASEGADSGEHTSEGAAPGPDPTEEGTATDDEASDNTPWLVDTATFPCVQCFNYGQGHLCRYVAGRKSCEQCRKGRLMCSARSGEFAGLDNASFIRFVCETRAAQNKVTRRLTRLEASLARVQARVYEALSADLKLGGRVVKDNPVEQGSDGISARHDPDSLVLDITSRESSEAVASQRESDSVIDVDAMSDVPVVKTKPPVEESDRVITIKKEPGAVDNGEDATSPSKPAKKSK
ncbi:hypothetical protein BD311DRAFT_787639 [Dichomitus squalens]|uniref:Uncharacterized protein n=1 Tax=Dichomitus squalens TaxID=114155 RepID=A0A4Q9MTJ8_9APHY|nr:hypothetical protein BD311DRAFT_787639 [Dichomitus squalens]